jgi:hypothetical protein
MHFPGSFLIFQDELFLVSGEMIPVAIFQNPKQYLKA